VQGKVEIPLNNRPAHSSKQIDSYKDKQSKSSETEIMPTVDDSMLPTQDEIDRRTVPQDNNNADETIPPKRARGRPPKNVNINISPPTSTLPKKKESAENVGEDSNNHSPRPSSESGSVLEAQSENSKTAKKKGRKTLPQSDEGCVDLMVAECFKSCRDLDLLVKLMDKTRDFRKEFFPKIQFDVAKGLKKFPALGDYRVVSVSYILLSLLML
jgi:hypothetical protein